MFVTLASVGAVWLTLLRLVPVCHGVFSDFPAGASKWDIRHKVWDYMEEKNLANFPRPVHNRIPNFKAG